MMVIQHATAVYFISVQDKQCHIRLNIKGSNSNYQLGDSGWAFRAHSTSPLLICIFNFGLTRSPNQTQKSESLFLCDVFVTVNAKFYPFKNLRLQNCAWQFRNHHCKFGLGDFKFWNSSISKFDFVSGIDLLQCHVFYFSQ